jgi:hypothetical protein
MPVVAGTTYTMSIRLWPEDRRWEAEIAGGGRVVKSTDLAGEPMRFRSPAPRKIDRAAGGVLHFGGRVREPGETLEFSVDDVDIAPVRN